MTATARNLSLYQIGADYDALLDAIQENGGEVSPEIEAQLTAITDAFDEKVERCALYIRTQESLATAATLEARRLTDLAAVRQRSADALRAMVFRLMEQTGKTKVVKPLATVSIQPNGGVLPVKWIGKDEEIPAPYRLEKPVYSLDRAKVLADHEAKVALPEGLTVGERGRSLRIR